MNTKIDKTTLAELHGVCARFGLTTRASDDVRKFETKFQGGTTFVETGSRASEAAHAIADAQAGTLKQAVDRICGGATEKFYRLRAAYRLLDAIGVGGDE